MENYVQSLMAEVKAKNPNEPEFHQAAQEVVESVSLLLDRDPRYRKANIRSENYVQSLMAEVKAKNPNEPEFHQAAQEVVESVSLLLDRDPRYRKAKILERMIEP